VTAIQKAGLILFFRVAAAASMRILVEEAVVLAFVLVIPGRKVTVV
jgi:hypothetical protein